MRNSIALFALLPVILSAQTVRGRVSEKTSGTAMAGVVVQLLDRNGFAVASALTDANGAYRLYARGAGDYTVRTLRIGFRPQNSAVIPMALGEEVTRDLVLDMIVFHLDTLRVVGRNSCREREGTEIASGVWEQARTALISAQLAAALPALDATLKIYERTYNPGSPRIREQQEGIRSGLTTSPWKAPSIAKVRAEGYVTEDSQGYTIFDSPDVGILLSREFQADHCFRLAKSKDNSLTGVAFEPTRERGSIPDLKGTIWLDTKTAELKRLEYRYTNVAPAQEDEGAGGSMDFGRMKNGGFAIASWHIRMPVVGLRELGNARGAVGPQQRLTEIRVAGGVLVSVTVGGDTIWTQPGITITGFVTDSASGGRITRGSVSIVGTDKSGALDERGRFVIPDVLPGEYTLGVRTASLDSANAVHHMAVTVDSSSKPFNVRVARAADLARALCSFDRSWNRSSPPGVIIGSSRLVGDSLPPRNVSVAAEWEELQLGGGKVHPVKRWKETRTNDKGEFRLCGVPVNTQIVVRAAGDSAEAKDVVVKIPNGARFERTEMVFDQVLSRSGVLMGVVVLDSTEALADVEVSLPDLKRSMLTDERGRFRFSNVPAGELKLTARRIGYGALDAKVRLLPSQTLSRRIVLTKVPQLEVVEVSASALPPEFEENRRLGLGSFLTRADIAKLENVGDPASVFRQLPGLQVLPGNSYGRNAMVAYNNRVTRSREPVALGGGATDGNPLGLVFGCKAVVFVDKVMKYSGRPMEPDFNLNDLRPEAIEAIQWYRGKVETPAEYSSWNNECGVLVIHTRKEAAPKRVDSLKTTPKAP